MPERTIAAKYRVVGERFWARRWRLFWQWQRETLLELLEATGALFSFRHWSLYEWVRFTASCAGLAIIALIVRTVFAH